jgi:uroporphyrinogen III methyltransferase/synthase
MMRPKAKKRGFVYLVGAGPGRADLITVRGAEVLKSADCIIYDRLANPALLKFARGDAEIIAVPKRAGKARCTQPEINELLLEKARGRRIVVRLKGGDPCIFGRCTEEAAALAEAGIDFEIVPGVTAAVAAAGYTGIILTDREYSSQVIFVTGHEAPQKQESSIDWDLLAKFRGAIVFYMAVGRLDSIAKRLMKNGASKDTPAAVIADATLPTQRVVKAPLSRIADTCKQRQVEPPSIIVIGTAAESDARLSWFMKKPLFGKSIVVTRDERGNAKFTEKILERGGHPVELATIKMVPLTRKNKFVKTLTRLSQYDWIVFTSANGVTLFFDSVQKLEKDARVFAGAKVAAIGTETGNSLRSFGINADFVPSVFTSEQLGRQLIRRANVKAKRVLLLRSEQASERLVELLQKAGAEVDDVALYRVATKKGKSQRLAEKIGADAVDWVTFASPSSARGFLEQIEPDLVNSSRTRVASIGPVTSQQLRDLGVKVDVEAAEHTLDGLLAAIEEMYQ